MLPVSPSVNTSISSKSALSFPFWVFLLARAGLSALGMALFAAGRVPNGSDPLLRPYFGIPPVTEGLRGLLLGIWQRFDAIHYLRIASGGYSATDLSVFFPLYPLLIRMTGAPLGHDFLLASILVSNVAALFALVAFYRLVIDDTHDLKIAQRATTYLVFFPTAFFLLAPYPESLSLLLTVVAFREARRGRWLQAGAVGLACSLVRLQGAMLALAFLAEAASRYRKGARLQILHAFAAAAPVLGVAGFIVWRSAVGFPSLSAVLVNRWQRVTAFPSYPLLATADRIGTGAAFPIEYLDLVVVGAMLVLGILVIKRLPLSFSVYYWGVLFFNLTQTRIPQPISSQARYSLALFPAFMVLGELGASPRLHRLILYSSFACWLFLAGQFVMWGWVG